MTAEEQVNNSFDVSLACYLYRHPRRGEPHSVGRTGNRVEPQCPLPLPLQHSYAIFSIADAVTALQEKDPSLLTQE